MSNPYQLIVFDWEGTISDTLGFILNNVIIETKRLGFGDIDPDEARLYVDLGLTLALKKLLPHLKPNQHELLVQEVQHAMITKPSEIALMPGVYDFIAQLHDLHYFLAVATNKGAHSLQKALVVTGLDKFFKVTRSAGQAPAKPCPLMLEEIMNEFNVFAPATLMIGDSIIDVEMAKSINVPVVGVDFYHQNEGALMTAGALKVFDDYQLLAEFLNLP